METRDFAPAAISNERDLLRLARLEAHRRAGGNVQTEAERGGAVELERLVDLEEVIVRADLHRPIPCVDDGQRHGRAPGVERDVAARRDDELAGMQRIRRAALDRADRLMQRDQLRAIREDAFDLEHRDHR